MGFFSNLKNAVTGGAVSVQLQMPAEAQRGQTISVKILGTAKANAKVNAVYLLVRARESAQIKDTDYANGKRSTETVQGFRTTFETRVPIAGGQDLAEGQSYSWDGQVSIPQASNPTFDGQMIDHKWEVQAGLDMSGNDPDSGWQPLLVS